MNDPFDHLAAGLDRRRFLQLVSAAGLGLLSSGGLWGAEPSAQTPGSRTPSETFDIAIVGLGAQGRILLEAIQKIPTVRVVAICDIWEYSSTYVQRLLKKSDILVNVYEDHRTMLEKEKTLTAVIVATPDFWHAPVTNDCLSAGLHVYCEKMMSNTLEGARSMVAAMRKSGKLLQIGHQRRSNPRYIVARNRIVRGDAKALGRITAINGQWNRAAGTDFGWPAKATMKPDHLAKYGFKDMHQFRNWRWFKDLGGGPLSDLGAHQIDIYNWFLDAYPTRVMASGGADYYQNHEWFDNAMVIYEYQTADGPVRAFYQVQTTTSAGGGYFEQFMGIDGSLKMSENPKITALYHEAAGKSWDDLLRSNVVVANKAAPAPADTAKVDARETAALASYQIPVVMSKAIHQPHLENFFDSIRGRTKLTCPADEALRSEIAVFKAIEAVETKNPVICKPEDFIV